MRQVVLDTETTGLEASKGHRVIEIGCVELLQRRPSGRTFHYYLNPEREVDEGARAVHGINNDFLADKPFFRDIAAEFMEFVTGAEIIAHNASFDIGFLDAELALLGPGYGRVRDHAEVLDTLMLAREKFPGQQNNLNTLCRRLGVDVSHRSLHGALLDAQLLADAYLAMTSGQQDLGFVPVETARPASPGQVTRVRPALRVQRASAQELEIHAHRLATINAASGGKCVWLQRDEDEALATA